MNVPNAALEWVSSSDTGISSLTIFRVLSGGIAGNRNEHVPRDFADFGRCYRLLNAVPEWRPRIPEMAAVSTQWAQLAARWAELEAHYLADLRATGQREPTFITTLRACQS